LKEKITGGKNNMNNNIEELEEEMLTKEEPMAYKHKKECVKNVYNSKYIFSAYYPTEKKFITMKLLVDDDDEFADYNIWCNKKCSEIKEDIKDWQYKISEKYLKGEK
jgi:hypothetical protein